MTSRNVLKARSAFAGLAAVTADAGLSVQDCDGLGLATVLARRNASVALMERVRQRFGIELPMGSQRTGAGAVAFAGIGPGAWLATSEQGGNAFATSLRGAVGNLASVSDQTGGYAVLRLHGPRIRETLARLVPVDLHPHAFGVGSVAVTAAGHIGVTLSRLEDANGAPAFEIVVFRSLAADFWHSLIG